MATTYYNDIQKLYVAYFNRPGDTAGLAYWETVVENAKGSTAAVSAAFAASAEYQSNYAGMTNAAIVNTVYMNLFGRAADAGGQKYFTDLMNANKLTVSAVVTEIAKGAQGSDAVAYAAKVAAANAFSNALTASDSYNTASAAVAAKTYITGVTDNASLAAATDPIALQVAIAKVDAAAQPFSLQTGLASLAQANALKASFLASADGDNDPTTSTNDAAIAANVTAKAAVVGATLKVVDTDVANADVVYANSATSPAIKAALVTEAQANLAANLTTAQNALTTANNNIAKVAGLSDAITALTAAKSAASAAATADTAAHVDVAVKVASYNVQNTPTLTIADNNYATVLAASSSVITADSKGNLSLATGVTEANHPGVTALMNSLMAEKAADTALTGANTAQANARVALNYLDLDTTSKADLTAIGNAMTIVKVASGTLPSQAQITTELTNLNAIALTNQAAVTGALSSYNGQHSGSPAVTAAADYSVSGLIDNNAGTLALHTGVTESTNAGVTALLNALKTEKASDMAYSSFNGLVTTFNSDLALDTDPLLTAQTSATASVKTANDAITAFNKALADLSTATTVQTQLAAVNGQIAAAQKAFGDNSMGLPVALDATHTTNFASAGADIYYVPTSGMMNSTITNFGLLGSDALYLGNKYTLNTTGDLTQGNDNVLEAFIIKSGSDTKIVLEQKAFASHETGGLNAPDLVTITLTGVDSTKVHLNNGIITVS